MNENAVWLECSKGWKLAESILPIRLWPSFDASLSTISNLPCSVPNSASSSIAKKNQTSSVSRFRLSMKVPSVSGPSTAVATTPRSSVTLFVFELTCVLFLPLLVAQVLWIWTMKSVDGQAETTRLSFSSGLESKITYVDTDLTEIYSQIKESVKTHQQSVLNTQGVDIKLLCIVDVPLFNATHPPSPVDHISKSWGADCADVLYFQHVYNATDRLQKLRQFYETQVKSSGHGHSQAEYSWILHAHPATFVMVKNLKRMIGPFPHDVPIVIGHNAKALALSNGALQHMLKDTRTRPSGATGTGNTAAQKTLCEYLFSTAHLNEQALAGYKVALILPKDEEDRFTFLEAHSKTLNGSVLNFRTQLRLEKDVQYGSRHVAAIPDLNPPAFVAMDYLLNVLQVGPVDTNWTQSTSTPNTVPEAKSLDVNNSYVMTADELDSTYLSREVKILCMILTGPRNHMKKAIHVKRTWGRRCNILVFLSSQSDSMLRTVPLSGVKEGREYLWQKMQAGFRYVYEHFRDEVDWFFKADDDTYAIMENLRMLLQSYNPEKPQYLGLRLKGNFTHPWATGGAGYAVSKAGLKRLVEDALLKPANTTKCPVDLFDVPEDVFTSLCMHYLNIPYVDTRDEFRRQRFFQHAVKHVVNGDIPDFFYEEYQYYPIAKNMSCCSPSAVSFHYIEPFQMYEMEYIVYDLNESGRRYYLSPSKPKIAIAAKTQTKSSLNS